MIRFVSVRALAWFGLSLSGVAYTWKLWQATGSGWWLVASGLAGTGVGILAALPAGWIADRFERRRVVAASALAQAAAYICLAGSSRPLALLAAGCLLGLAGAPFWPALGAALLAAFGGSAQVRVLGLSTSGESAGIVGGTLAGAGLLAINHNWPFWASCACLVLTGLLALQLPAPAGDRERVTEGQEDGEKKSSLLAGLEVLRGDQLLRLLLGSVMFMVVSRQLAIVSEAPLVSALGGGGQMLALVSAAWSIGMIGGGWWASRRARSGRSLHYLWRARLAVAVGMSGLFFSTTAWQPAVLYLLCGLAWAWIPVASGVILAERCADQQRGRLMAFQGAAVQVAGALGMTGAGIALSSFGAKGSFLAAGLLGLLSLIPLTRALHLPPDSQKEGNHNQGKDLP